MPCNAWQEMRNEIIRIGNTAKFQHTIRSVSNWVWETNLNYKAICLIILIMMCSTSDSLILGVTRFCLKVDFEQHSFFFSPSSMKGIKSGRGNMTKRNLRGEKAQKSTFLSQILCGHTSPCAFMWLHARQAKKVAGLVVF